MKRISKKYELTMYIPFTETVLQEEAYFSQLYANFKDIFTFFVIKTRKLGNVEFKINWAIMDNAIIEYREKKEKVKLDLPIILSCEEIDLKPTYIYNIMNHYIEVVMYDIFFIVNLSSPGSFSIYNCILKVDQEYKITFKYDECLFDVAAYNHQRNNGIELVNIDLYKVHKWYYSISSIDNQISTNSVNRSIFAILNCINIDVIVPTSIIWLTHAIESVYNLPSTGIQSALINRVNIVLQIPEKNRKNIRKRIVKFYNLRSRFVHGDFSISHPIQNEVLDDKVDNYIIDILDSYSYISNILLATLQKMIIKNCKELRFEETVKFD